MGLYDKVVLEFETSNEMIDHEVRQMVNLVNTAISVSMMKPSIKKEIEDDPESFFRTIIEEHVARRIEEATDILYERHEQTVKYFENIKDMFPSLMDDAIGKASTEERQISEEALNRSINDFVNSIQEAREIVENFFLEEIDTGG